MTDALRRKHLNPSTLPPAVTAKWPAEILIEGFVPFPKRLLRVVWKVLQGEQALKELAVVMAVSDFKRPKQDMHPSLDYLAYIAGMSKPEFVQCLRSLRDKGLITASGNENEAVINIDGLIKKAEELAAADDAAALGL